MAAKDDEIIKLLFGRDESGITEMSNKYKGYCNTIALNILDSREDAEECVNDTFLAAWNTIPPNSPEKLSAYLGKLARNNAINRLEKSRAAKRGSGGADVVLDELAEILPSNSSVEQDQETKELMGEINKFLHGLSSEKRSIFVCRYFFCDSVKDIAAASGISENKVSVTLNRVRARLKAYLEKKGY